MSEAQGRKHACLGSLVVTCSRCGKPDLIALDPARIVLVQQEQWPSRLTELPGAREESLPVRLCRHGQQVRSFAFQPVERGRSVVVSGRALYFRPTFSRVVVAQMPALR